MKCNTNLTIFYIISKQTKKYIKINNNWIRKWNQRSICSLWYFFFLNDKNQPTDLPLTLATKTPCHPPSLSLSLSPPTHITHTPYVLLCWTLLCQWFNEIYIVNTFICIMSWILLFFFSRNFKMFFLMKL